jgi:S1-C subfamily serine protease
LARRGISIIVNDVMRLRRLLLIAALLPALAACAQVETVDYLPAPPPPADAHPAPVGFSGLKLDLPLGRQIGALATDNGILPCSWPYKPASRTMLRETLAGAGVKDDLRQRFRDTFAGQGYDVAGTLDFAFDDTAQDEELRGEYKIGGIVRAAALYACDKEPNTLQWAFGMRGGYRGELRLGIDWSVYDALRRAVVYRAHSEGYAKRRVANEEGLALLLGDAFEMAAHNLGADPQLRALLFEGKKPGADGGDRRRAELIASRPRRFDPREKVRIANPPLSRRAFAADSERGRRVAVTVQAGGAYGSGFFIDAKGHLLTSAHVVGDALRVRVVTADGQALVAETVRADAPRDVALLRLEALPPDPETSLEIVTLPLRAEIPRVSEPVYAIGTPGRRLEGTVAAGIVSAFRKAFRIAGARQDFIQADIPLKRGNSGGPLLDANGNILGLAQGEISADGALNLFVPIGQALSALGIALENPSPAGREAAPPQPLARGE